MVDSTEKEKEEKSLFEKIIDGDLPCDFVMENEHVFCFKDISPQAPSHYLMVPKKRVNQFREVVNSQKSLEQAAHCLQALIVLGDEKFKGQHFGLCINDGVGALQTVFHLHFHFLAERILRSIDLSEQVKAKSIIKTSDYEVFNLPKPQEDPQGPNYHGLQLNVQVPKAFLQAENQNQKALGIWESLINAIVDAAKRLQYGDYRVLLHSNTIVDEHGRLNVVLVSGEGMGWPPF